MPKRRILLLTPQLPYPPQQGTSLRNYHIVRGLAQVHDVHLLSFVEPGQDAGSSVAALEAFCEEVIAVPAPVRTTTQRFWRLFADRRPDMAHRLQSAAFEDALRDALTRRRFDVVQIEGIELAAHVPLIRSLCPTCKIVFDDHNAEAELQRRMFATDVRSPRRWLAAAYSYVQWRRLRRFERETALAVDGVTVVSEADRQHLEMLAPGLEPVVIPNCIDMERYQHLPSPSHAFSYDLLFIGKMDYRPNVDAVLWFGEEIWPLIREQRPDATWAVVGKQPHARLAPLIQARGVTVTGAVAAIEPYLAGASVYVMPFRIGSGTRLKLIEAMAAGVATVSTAVGAEGYPLRDGKHLLLRDHPTAFADAVLMLLDDGEMRNSLRSTAREFAEQYDWRRVIPRFSELYDRLLTA